MTSRHRPGGSIPTSRRFWLAGLVAALLVAGVLSFYASSAPDGLERVTGDLGISQQAGEHSAAGSPLADYQTGGVEDTRASGAIAGVIGVAVVLALGSGLTWTLRRRDDETAAPSAPTDARTSPHGG